MINSGALVIAIVMMVWMQEVEVLRGLEHTMS